MYWVIFFGGIFLDRITKLLVKTNMELHQRIEVIPQLLHLTYEHNKGAAFSILQGKLWFFIIFTVLAFVLVIYLWRQSNPQQKLFRVSLALLAGGAIGNFIDRIIYGYVIDFFELPWIPIFNIADMMIVFSIALIFLKLIFSKEEGFR